MTVVTGEGTERCCKLVSSLEEIVRLDSQSPVQVNNHREQGLTMVGEVVGGAEVFT